MIDLLMGGVLRSVFFLLARLFYVIVSSAAACLSMKSRCRRLKKNEANYISTLIIYTLYQISIVHSKFSTRLQRFIE